MWPQAVQKLAAIVAVAVDQRGVAELAAEVRGLLVQALDGL
jgi:hypothetical protein